MRILNIDRWTSTEAEHFIFYTDTTAGFSSTIVVDWVSEGKSRSAAMTIDSVTSTVIKGHLAGNFTGDFRVAGINIHTDEGVQEIKIEKGDSFTESPKLEAIDLEDPFEVEVWNNIGYGSAGVSYQLIPNRIFDWGSSGLDFFKIVADGWNLPGILEPAMADEDQIQEYLEQKYDEDDLNTVYIVGDEVVFLRSTPAGNEALRAPIGEVYSFSTDDGWGTTPAPNQVTMGPLPYIRNYEVTDPDLQAPKSEHFQEEIQAIFDEMDRNEELTMQTYDTILSATNINGDRLADEHYSAAYRNGYGRG